MFSTMTLTTHDYAGESIYTRTFVDNTVTTYIEAVNALTTSVIEDKGEYVCYQVAIIPPHCNERELVTIFQERIVVLYPIRYTSDVFEVFILWYIRC